MTSSPVPAEPAGPTVLVGEDDHDVRDLITFKLAAAGYRTLAVDNGNAALSVTHSERPDLVVLDIDMPGLDGLTVCQQIKGLSRTASTPVLILSGRTRDIDVSQGRTMGADDYLVKPFHPEELIRRVAHLLGAAS